MSKQTEDAYQWGLAGGEMMERQRIIHLLETEAAVNRADAEFFQGKQSKHSRTFAEAYESVIALIKGYDK